MRETPLDNQGVRADINEPRPTVIVVDDDAEVRRSVSRLIGSVGLGVVSFASVQEFWNDCDLTRPGCLVLDMRLPDRSGLDLLEELDARHVDLPVIIITAFGDVPSAVRAMRARAVDFLQKPFNDQLFLDSVQRAIQLSLQRRRNTTRISEIRTRIDSLSPRERQVMDLVVSGKSNKMVAAALTISQKTAENYRAHLMKKMGAESLAELVQMALAARRDDRAN